MSTNPLLGSTDSPVSSSFCNIFRKCFEKCIRSPEYIWNEPIETGGNATVYTATEPMTGRKVAIKVHANTHNEIDLHEQYKVYQQLWLAYGQQVFFPFVRTHGVFSQKDKDMLVMQKYECDLFQRIFQHQKLSLSQARTFARDIATALQMLHTLGWVHRDVKPENILISEDRAYLGDFGFCVPIGSTQARRLGTARFVAPEGLTRGTTLSTALDAWSLGVCIFVMTRGCFPFDTSRADSLVKQNAAIREKAQQGWKGISPLVWNRVDTSTQHLLQNLLCADPRDRWTMDEFLESDWAKGGP